MKLEKIFFAMTIILGLIIIVRGYSLFGWHFNIVDIAYIIYFSVVFYLQYDCAFNDFYNRKNKVRGWIFKTIIKSEKRGAYTLFVFCLTLVSLLTLCIIVIPKFPPMYVGIKLEDLLSLFGAG